MLNQLQTAPTRLSRPARVALAVLAIVALAAPLVYLSRAPAIMADDPDKAIKPPVEEFLPPLSESEKKITAELDKPTEFDFVGTPLQDVVDFLKDKHSLEIQLDTKALEEAGVGSDTPVSCKVKGISLRSALRLLLGRHDLAFVIQDEVLLITSGEVADARLFTRTYPVGDLVVDDDYDGLIEAITSTVAPQTWDEVGGPGSLSTVKSAGSLVISQTRDVHEKVLQLLRSLRGARQAGGAASSQTSGKATSNPSDKSARKVAKGRMGGVGSGTTGTGDAKPAQPATEAAKDKAN